MVLRCRWATNSGDLILRANRVRSELNLKAGFLFQRSLGSFGNIFFQPVAVFSHRNGIGAEVIAEGLEGFLGFRLTFSQEFNSFTGNTIAAILVDRAEATITGDDISDNGVGVLVRNGGSAIIQNNAISNNQGDGVAVHDNSTAVISGNTISFNGGAGVWVSFPQSSVIEGNSIFSNTGLGIDLGARGRTPNDPGDADSGLANVQDFPELLSAIVNADGDLVVEYTIDSDPENSAYPLTVQFFQAESRTTPQAAQANRQRQLRIDGL